MVVLNFLTIHIHENVFNLHDPVIFNFVSSILACNKKSIITEPREPVIVHSNIYLFIMIINNKNNETIIKLSKIRSYIDFEKLMFYFPHSIKF